MEILPPTNIKEHFYLTITHIVLKKEGLFELFADIFKYIFDIFAWWCAMGFFLH